MSSNSQARGKYADAIGDILVQNPNGITFRVNEFKNYLVEKTGIAPQWGNGCNNIHSILVNALGSERLENDYFVRQLWNGNLLVFGQKPFAVTTSGGSVLSGKYDINGQFPHIIERLPFETLESKEDWYTEISLREGRILDMVTSKPNETISADLILLALGKEANGRNLNALKVGLYWLNSKLNGGVNFGLRRVLDTPRFLIDIIRRNQGYDLKWTNDFTRREAGH
jgi:hypothetical protein